MWLALAIVLHAAPGPVERPCPAGVAVARDAQAFSAALADETAPEVWVAGLIHGDFSASRTLRLHGCEHAVIDGTRTATVLKLHGDDVLVEDLTLRGSGERTSSEDGALKVSGERVIVRRVRAEDTLYGVALEQCHACVLEHSAIHGRLIEHNQRGDGVKLWEAHGSMVRDLLVEDVRDVVVWYSRHVTLERNTIVRGRYGTHFMYAHDSVVRDSTLRDNVVGVFVMYCTRVTIEGNVLAGAKGPAGMGIGFKEADDVTLTGNQLVANTVGVFLDLTPRNPDKRAHFEGNLFALNRCAVRAHSPERGATFIHNDFTSNDSQVETDGNSDALTVRFEHNTWDGYAGYDLNGDGEGDVAYVTKAPSSELREAYPTLRYFHGSVAMALYDAMAEALPYFGAKVMFTDPTPAMRPHHEVPR